MCVCVCVCACFHVEAIKVCACVFVCACFHVVCVFFFFCLFLRRCSECLFLFRPVVNTFLSDFFFGEKMCVVHVCTFKVLIHTSLYIKE